MACVFDGTALRDKILRSLIADVCFGRSDIIHVGGGLGSRSGYRNKAGRLRGCTGLGKELLDHPLGAVIIAFAEMMMANTALGIDEVMRRPIFVVEGAPDRIVVVDRQRIADLEIGNSVAQVAHILLEL